jgi:hypothetical protein
MNESGGGIDILKLMNLQENSLGHQESKLDRYYLSEIKRIPVNLL